MYVSMHVDMCMYMYVIVLSLPPAALQLKEKKHTRVEEKRSYTSKCPPSVAIKS